MQEGIPDPFSHVVNSQDFPCVAVNISHNPLLYIDSHHPSYILEQFE